MRFTNTRYIPESLRRKLDFALKTIENNYETYPQFNSGDICNMRMVRERYLHGGNLSQENFELCRSVIYAHYAEPTAKVLAEQLSMWFNEEYMKEIMTGLGD